MRLTSVIRNVTLCASGSSCPGARSHGLIATPVDGSIGMCWPPRKRVADSHGPGGVLLPRSTITTWAPAACVAIARIEEKNVLPLPVDPEATAFQAFCRGSNGSIGVRP